MTTRPAPICGGCKHFRKPKAEQVGYTCDAFPELIPTPIILNQADHRQPYEGDNGITFEPTRPQFAEYADRVFESK